MTVARVAVVPSQVTIEECSATIKSIELQLVRVETCFYQDGQAREATEIQNIQIADGPVCHQWPIPVHMVFPRLFTCPTISTRSFKVDFEVNLVILFSDGHLLTENFPLKLVRTVLPPSAASGDDDADLLMDEAISDPDARDNPFTKRVAVQRGKATQRAGGVTDDSHISDPLASGPAAAAVGGGGGGQEAQTPASPLVAQTTVAATPAVSCAASAKPSSHPTLSAASLFSYQDPLAGDKPVAGDDPLAVLTSGAPKIVDLHTSYPVLVPKAASAAATSLFGDNESDPLGTDPLSTLTAPAAARGLPPPSLPPLAARASTSLFGDGDGDPLGAGDDPLS